MRTKAFAALLLTAGTLAGCGNSEAVRYNPGNPLRFRNPRQWEKERAEFLARDAAEADAVAEARQTQSSPGKSKSGQSGRLTLSLKDAVDFAFEHNPQMVSARLDKERARGQIVSARSGAFPSLSLSASYLRMGEVPSFDVPGLGTITVGSADNYRAAFTLAQPIYVGGKVRNALRIAQKYEESTDAFCEAAELGARFNVTRTYYGVVLAGKRSRMMEEQYRLARSHLQDTETMYREGVVLKLHVMRARSALSLAETGLIQAQNDLDTARRDFLLAIGAPVSEKVVLTTDLPEPVTERLEPPDISELRSSRPDIMAFQTQIDMQKLNLGIVSGDRKPTIAAFGEFGWEKPSTKTMGSLDWADYWQAGVNLSWNIFDSGYVSGKLIDERAALRQMEEQLTANLRSAQKEVLDAVAQIDGSARLLEAQRSTLFEAKEALRLAQAGFEEGTVTQVELLDAQTALTSARLAYAEALYAHALARASYEMATGKQALPERSD